MIEDDENAEGEAFDAYADMRAAKDWLEAIRDAEKYFEYYHEKCDSIDKQLADLKRLAEGGKDSEFQIFWANLEVLKPSIYSRPPVPVVVPRFKDRKQLPRHASEIIERTLITAMDSADLHAEMLAIRDDLATSGRGAAWCRYENDGQDERLVPEHVDRRDFLHEPARKWKEVGWVGRRAWMTREQMRERFEDTSGEAWMHAEFKEHKDDKGEDYKGEKKAAVWEIWDKKKGVVVWVTPNVPDVLDIGEPHLDLEGFFPCPEPVYSGKQRGTLIPIPDFVYYRDQVDEINALTNRITALSEALKVKGFYAAGQQEVGDAIETAMRSQNDNAILIPIPNIGALGGAGAKDAIVWLPIDQIATTIAQCVELRKQLIQDVYEITGISDIMRGSTDSNETLGAQQLKSQYGSVRVRDKQEGLIRIARDIIRIGGEIIAENFAPETIMAMSQYDRLPMQVDPQQMQHGQEPPVTLPDVFNFIRDQRMRSFVLEIETDSTILPDENAAKQRVTEFLGAMAQALGQLAPMVAQTPQSAPFAGEVLKFSLTPFRAGREMEAAVDDFVEQMTGAAQQAAQQPNPEAVKAEMESKAKEAEIAIKRDELQLKAQESAAKIKLERDKLAVSTRSEAMRTLGEQGGNVSEMMEAELQQVDALLAELKAGREQQAQQTQQLAQMMQMLGQAMMAPKEVIRDETGAPVGVRPVMPQAGTVQ